VHSITLLEATNGIATGASGKAGGLLALWAYPDCLVPLSYRLHRELAAEHDGANRWGYRRVGCGSIAATVTGSDIKKARDNSSSPKVGVPLTKVDVTGPAAPAAQEKPGGPEPGLVDSNGSSSSTNGSPYGLEHNNSAAVPLGSDAAELPIKSTIATTDNTDINTDIPKESSKEWEKLPKQDQAATELLQESLLPSDLDWIDANLVYHYEEMGSPGATETAQVHPYQFTNAMAELAREKGVDIRLGAKVTRINHSKTGGVQSVEYVDRRAEFEAGNGEGQESGTGLEEVVVVVMDDVTDVIVTAGPWTGRLLPKSKVEGLRAHSVVLEADVSPYAVFTDIQLPSDYVPEHRAKKGQKRRHRGHVDPEVYARPGGEVYACGKFSTPRPPLFTPSPKPYLTSYSHISLGEPDTSIPLPETADLVQCDTDQCDDLVAYLGTVSPVLGSAPVRARQACYLPRHMRFGEERGPLIGQTSTPGLWIAAGHTCWGIQNGPGTGCLMAEMLLDGEARSADVGKLDPSRFKV